MPGAKKAYIIAEVHSVHDMTAFARYREEVAPLVDAHGGKFLARGGEIKTLEGDEFRGGVAVMEFSDRTTAENFWFSDEYAQIAQLRHNSAQSRIYLVDGLADEALD